MAGGTGNPLGARALYIGATVYRIHGTNAPQAIGQAVSSGCFRMVNDDVTTAACRSEPRLWCSTNSPGPAPVSAFGSCASHGHSEAGISLPPRKRISRNTSRPRFTPADIVRAIEGVEAAGLQVCEVETTSTGAIKISTTRGGGAKSKCMTPTTVRYIGLVPQRQ
jgi:hypothetical protein